MSNLPTADKLHQELGHLITADSTVDTLRTYAAYEYLYQFASADDLAGLDYEIIRGWLTVDSDELQHDMRKDIVETMLSSHGDKIVKEIQECAAELHAEELRERGLHVPTNQERAADDAGVPTRGEF